MKLSERIKQNKANTAEPSTLWPSNELYPKADAST